MKSKKTANIIMGLIILTTLLFVGISAYASNGGCGLNLTWEMDLVGNLVVSGTGEMEDYSSNGCGPWGTSVKTIVIENGVESISNKAFCGCVGLTRIELPESLKAIGDYAFKDCTSLASITLPDNITSIGNNVFSNCITKKYAKLGSSTAKGLGYPFFDIESKCAFTYSGENIFLTGAEQDAINLVVPVAVKRTNGNFSDYSNLKSISFPEGIESINREAFKDNTSIETLTSYDF